MGGDNEAIGPNGLPIMKEEEKKSSSIAPFLIIFPVVGAAIAFGLFSALPPKNFNNKLEVIKYNELEFIYISAVLFTFLVRFLNFYPMKYKSKIMGGKSGNLRANMQVRIHKLLHLHFSLP